MVLFLFAVDGGRLRSVRSKKITLRGSALLERQTHVRDEMKICNYYSNNIIFIDRVMLLGETRHVTN